MAKLPQITQGDYGIFFDVAVTNESNQPIKLSSDDEIKIHIQYPDNTCEDLENEHYTVIDRNKLLVRITLAEPHTKEEGYHQFFIAVKGLDYKVNADKSIAYVVLPKHNVGEH